MGYIKDSLRRHEWFWLGLAIGLLLCGLIALFIRTLLFVVFLIGFAVILYWIIRLIWLGVQKRFKIW